MSKRHVEEYYSKMFSDYCEMKSVLEELQNTLPEDKISEYADRINDIKTKLSLLEANYKRLSYIIFLLNMPNKKKKEKRYIQSEHKKLDVIPIKDRKESVEQENNEILSSIKNIE